MGPMTAKTNGQRALSGLDELQVSDPVAQTSQVNRSPHAHPPEGRRVMSVDIRRRRRAETILLGTKRHADAERKRRWDVRHYNDAVVPGPDPREHVLLCVLPAGRGEVAIRSDEHYFSGKAQIEPPGGRIPSQRRVKRSFSIAAPADSLVLTRSHRRPNIGGTENHVDARLLIHQDAPAHCE